MTGLLYRRAVIEDLPTLVRLLIEDDLGCARESLATSEFDHYVAAFSLIDCDPNQYLMVVEYNRVLVGTCHLTLMPSLTFRGTCRMQIEAVRVAIDYRGKGIGRWMMLEAIAYGKERGARLFQLTTNMARPEAKRFYEGLGFEATHIGMKFLEIGVDN